MLQCQSIEKTYLILISKIHRYSWYNILACPLERGIKMVDLLTAILFFIQDIKSYIDYKRFKR